MLTYQRNAIFFFFFSNLLSTTGLLPATFSPHASFAHHCSGPALCVGAVICGLYQGYVCQGDNTGAQLGYGCHHITGSAQRRTMMKGTPAMLMKAADLLLFKTFFFLQF